MYNFQFHRPTGLRQASNMLGKLEEAKILAGGQTLIPTMKLRLAQPGNLIDLNTVEGLSGIEVKGRSIVVIEHDMAFVRMIAHKVTVLHQGKLLAEGSMEDVQNDERVKDVYLGH